MARHRNARALLALALLAAALLALPAVTGATPPERGVHYAGVIATQRTEEGRTFEFPIRFYVDGSGDEVEDIVFPEGGPFSPSCEAGPLGEPIANTDARITARGTVSTSIELDVPGQESGNPKGFGSVRLSGAFKPNGVFAGHYENRTTFSSCRVGYDFRMRARRG